MAIDETGKHVEYRVVEFPHKRETCLVKFIDGFQTTQVSLRKPWAKYGKQGAWQACSKHRSSPG